MNLAIKLKNSILPPFCTTFHAKPTDSNTITQEYALFKSITNLKLTINLFPTSLQENKRLRAGWKQIENTTGQKIRGEMSMRVLHEIIRKCNKTDVKSSNEQYKVCNATFQTERDSNPANKSPRSPILRHQLKQISTRIGLNSEMLNWRK